MVECYIFLLSSYKFYLSVSRAVIIDTLLFSFYFLWVFIACKYSDLKRWKEYYPTFLFWGLGDAIYNILFCDKPLWKYMDPLLNHTLSEFFTVAIVFSSATLLFLYHYPQKLYRQVIYIFVWVALFSGIEFIFYKLGSIVYYNSWTIRWSVVHNTYQFILLRLHYKRPFLAWISSFIILISIMIIFNIPLIY
jgi:hypothetical protein